MFRHKKRYCGSVCTTPDRGRWGRIGLRFGLVVISCMCLAPSAAFTAELEQITFGGGVLLKPTNVSGFALGVDFKAEDPPGILTLPGDDVHYELGISRWVDVGESPGIEDDIWFVEGGAFWRYRPEILPEHWYVDAGAGFAAASDQKIDKDRTLDSSLLFNADLTIARRFGRDRRWMLGARWRHNSNGGILGSPDRNPGADVVLLELGYRP